MHVVEVTRSNAAGETVPPMQYAPDGASTFPNRTGDAVPRSVSPAPSADTEHGEQGSSQDPDADEVRCPRCSDRCYTGPQRKHNLCVHLRSCVRDRGELSAAHKHVLRRIGVKDCQYCHKRMSRRSVHLHELSCDSRVAASADSTDASAVNGIFGKYGNETPQFVFDSLTDDRKQWVESVPWSEVEVYLKASSTRISLYRTATWRTGTRHSASLRLYGTSRSMTMPSSSSS